MALNFQNKGNLRISRIIAIVLVVVSILLLTLFATEGPTGPLHSLQNKFQAISAPFKLVGAASGSLVDSATEAAGNARASEETLSALKQQNEEMTELVAKAEEYRLEAKRLQDLLNLKDAYEIEGVSGRVIGRSLDAWSQTITIDVGTDVGVHPGLTVLGPSGVIGQVISASGGSAEVRLITDPQSGVAAMIQSSRAEGVLRGSLNGVLHLENVDDDVEVNVGDVVMTSGLGGSYTKGLLLGTVVRVEGNARDATRDIIVSQNERISALEEVIVVFSAAKGAE